jgi:hypothetical protein
VIDLSIKQDRIGARTATDLERKYNFGKTFAEMLGLINDSRDKVDSVESQLESVENSTKLMRDEMGVVVQAQKTIKKDITSINGDIDNINGDISELTSSVEMKLDADAVNIEIEKKIANGVDKVVITETGYRFDDKGLKISTSDSEISNLIDNTGMYVKNFGSDVLTANNQGVGAVNLHAKTYLIIGAGNGRSRIEDYGINRTGVFWIGG